MKEAEERTDTTYLFSAHFMHFVQSARKTKKNSLPTKPAEFCHWRWEPCNFCKILSVFLDSKSKTIILLWTCESECKLLWWRFKWRRLFPFTNLQTDWDTAQLSSFAVPVKTSHAPQSVITALWDRLSSAQSWFVAVEVIITERKCGN
jgi:hypothetical protein